MKNKLSTFIIGAALGAVAGLAVYYLFGPSSEEGEEAEGQANQPYRSRLQAALDAGRQAASEREAELLASFQDAKRS